MRSHVSRSEGTSSKSFLGHKCTGKTTGGGLMTPIGEDASGDATDYVGFGLSR
jgi:hypothetical protein